MKASRSKVKSKALPTRKLLSQVLQEVRTLRNEVSILLPSEGLEDYEHSDRIKRSYQKAIKKYPPAA